MKKRHRNRLPVLGVLVATVVLILIFAPYYRILTNTVKISPFKVMLGFGGLQTLNGRVNILLLGVPGGAHEGPNLSDSINVLSYDLKTNKLTTIGVPRDVWSDTLGQKINAAYATGEAIKPGQGITLARAEVSGIIGMPIHYGVVIRFEQFRKLIDFLEGIEVNAEHSFSDDEFPITGRESDECGGDLQYRCRYETISFEKGLRKMNGETALKYVRSRHATGAQGSDFSRNQRQQAVMKAIRAKLLSPRIILSPSKIEGLYQTLDTLVERDITNNQAALIVKNIIIKRNLVQSSGVLPRDLFTVPQAWQYNGQYVLIPEDGSFLAVHKYIDDLLNVKDFSEDK